MTRSVVWWLPLCAVFACGGSAHEDPSPDEPQGLEVSGSGELGPRSKVLDEQSLAALTSVANGAARFASVTPMLEGLAVDDIVLAGISPRTPEGLLVKVLGITPEAGGIVLQTQAATLEEAYENLTVTAKGKLPVAQNAAPGAPVEPMATARQSLGSTFPFLLRSSSDRGQIQLEGSLGVDASIGVDLSINVVEFEVRRAALTFDASESFSAQLTGNGESRVHEAQQLAQIDFPIITIPIPPSPVPLVITPRLVVEASIEGTAKGAVSSSMQQTAGFSSTLGYVDGELGGSFEPNASFNFEPPSYSGSLSLRAAAETRLEVFVYGSFGPYAGIETYLQLGANAEGPPPCVTGVLDAGLAAKVGMRTVLGHDAHTRPFEKRFELAKVDSCNPAADAPRPVPTWSRTYGRAGSAGEQARAAVEASDGTLLVVGTTGRFGSITSANMGLWAMRLDALGNVLWQRAFREVPLVGAARAVVENREGFLIAAEYGLMQIDPGGNLRWVKNIFEDGARISSVAVRSDNTLLVAGEKNNESVAWAMHTDARGTPLWSRTFGAESFARVRVTRDGGAILAGLIDSNVGDYFVVKLAADGSVEWQRAIDNRTVNSDSGVVDWGIDRAYDVAEKPAGGFVVVGTSLSIYPFSDRSGTAYYHPGVIDLDASGNLQQGRAYRTPLGSQVQSARAVGVRPDGSTLVLTSLAHEIEDMNVREDLVLIQNQSYVRFDGGKNDYPYEGAVSSGVPLVMTKDGGALLALTTNSFSTVEQIWLIKLNRAGSIEFPHRASIAGESLVTQAVASNVTESPIDAAVRPASIDLRELPSEQTDTELRALAP